MTTSVLVTSATRYRSTKEIAEWRWSLGAGVVAWLFLLPGASLIHAFLGLTNPDLTITIATLSAFSLLLTIATAFARDAQEQIAGSW